MSMLVKLNWSCVTRLIDVKMDESVYKEKSLFKMLGLSCTSELNGGFYITLRDKKNNKIKNILLRILFTIYVLNIYMLYAIHSN